MTIGTRWTYVEAIREDDHRHEMDVCRRDSER